MILNLVLFLLLLLLFQFQCPLHEQIELSLVGDLVAGGRGGRNLQARSDVERRVHRANPTKWGDILQRQLEQTGV